jgi:hypothetical protein
MRCQITDHKQSGFTGCRGWLSDFVIADESLTLEDVVHTVMSHGLEHHFVMVPGNCTSVLSEFSAWCGFETLHTRKMKPYLDTSDFS